MIAEKKCYRCDEIKLLEEFYKNKSTRDGYARGCKICSRAEGRKYRTTEQGKATREKYNNTKKRKTSNRRTDAKRSGTEQRRTSHSKASTRYSKKNPDKVKAQSAVNVAVKKSVLPHVKTLKCTDCERPAQQYDHWQGYDKHNWLNVQPVCIKCHSLRHRPS